MAYVSNRRSRNLKALPRPETGVVISRSILRFLPLLLVAMGASWGGSATSGSRGTAESPDLPQEDPLADGPFSVALVEYDAGSVRVGGAGQDHLNYSYDARLRGVLAVPDAPGPWPVAVFLHGQHSTCGMGGRESVVAPSGSCETAPWSPYPNHRGYDYLARYLASHGFLVASINAKEVNDRNGNPDVGMWGRGELVIATLDLLDRARRGEVDLGVPVQPDLTRIGLVGHSRGGEGVVTATHVNALRANPYAIQGVVALAPTDFNARGVANAALLSLVPYCDGDVFNLHGLRTFDHSRFLDDWTAKVQILVRGANHNNYNTNWGKEPILGVVPDGDDATVGSHMNTECDVSRSLGGQRLTREDTWNEAILHIGGFLHWSVAGKTELAPYFQGDAATPAAACPDAVGPCPDASRVSAILPGRHWIFNVSEQGANGLGAVPVSTTGFSRVETCRQATCDSNVYSAAWALSLEWDGPATVRVDLPARLFSNQDVLVFRAGVPTFGDRNAQGRPIDLSVVLIDADGGRHAQLASAHSRALHPPPGEVVEMEIEAAVVGIGTTKVGYHMVRIPLAAFAVDSASVSAVEIVFDQTPSGRLLLSDMWTQAERRIASN